MYNAEVWCFFCRKALKFRNLLSHKALCPFSFSIIPRKTPLNNYFTQM